MAPQKRHLNLSETKPNQNKKYSQNQGFGQFLAYSDMYGIQNPSLKLGNSMAISDKSFEPI